MKKYTVILFSMILILSISSGCKKKKEHPMVDMDSIKTDGSHDDGFIFKKEIQKEERREKKYKKETF